MTADTQTSALHKGHPVFGWHGVWALIALTVFALIMRSPNLLYTVLNWDESLYLMLGRDINDGYVLYSHIWDRKPPGIFLIYAFFDALPGHPMIWAHLFSNIAIGIGGWLVMRVTIRLTQGQRIAGWCAGLCYVGFSLSNGGLAANAEPFMMLFTLLGLWLLLAGFNLPHQSGHSRSAFLCLMGGLVMGVGLVVKTVLLFDILAFILLILLMSRGSDRSYIADLPALFGHGLITGLGMILPFGLTFFWFWALGHFDTYVDATILSYNNLASEAFRFRFGNVLIPMLDSTPLWAGTIVATCLWLFTGLRRYSLVITTLLIWIAVILAGIVFLRYYFDHYFLQLMPPMAIMSGLVLAYFVVGVKRSRLAIFLLPLILVSTASFALTRNIYLHAVFTAKAQLSGDAFVGRLEDRTAHWLNERLEQGEQIFVFTDDPILYPLTRTDPPTRFPFPSYLTETGAYGLIEPTEELSKIMDKKPRFVILRDDTFTPPKRLTFPEDHVALIRARLEADYQLAHHIKRSELYDVHPLGRYPHSKGVFIYELNAPL